LKSERDRLLDNSKRLELENATLKNDVLEAKRKLVSEVAALNDQLAESDEELHV
jgi:hypothetical protein